MTFKQLIQLLPKVVRYNLKIIFAGKFFWFCLLYTSPSPRD